MAGNDKGFSNGQAQGARPSRPILTPGSLSQLLPGGVNSSTVSRTTTKDVNPPLPALLARGLIEAASNGDANHPTYLYHIAPDFTGTNDVCQTPTPFTEFRDMLLELKANYPAFHMGLISDSVDLDDQNGQATVWQFSKVTGYPESVERKNLGMSKWRRSMEGVWLCYEWAAYRSDGDLVAPT